MTETTQTLPFQAEAKELLELVIHSLYSQREVFLRELISNASDALDKLRLEAHSHAEWSVSEAELAIRVEIEPARGVLRVIDSGIGMSREELARNLGTIAHSGTRKFKEQLAATQASAEPGGHAAGAAGLIGRFGVGFYSAFLVADHVRVESTCAGSNEGWRWSSSGQGEFQLEPVAKSRRGTCVELQLKRADPEAEPSPDYCDPAELARLVRRYSDFIEWPIQIAAAHWDAPAELKRLVAADGLEVLVLNSQKPLWERAKEDIRPDEYAQLYRHLTHGEEAPMESLHFRAEGAQEYTALLFLPAQRREEPFQRPSEHADISLYVKRVFVMDHCEHLAPPWLRFVTGVVDSLDLPLNVSREVLVENRLLRQIQGKIVQKVLAALGEMLRERRADYERWWMEFGAVLKEGIVLDPARRDELLSVCLFPGTTGAWSLLSEYQARAPKEQSKMYVLSGTSKESCERSQHLEALRSAGREALFFVDPVDEWILAQVDGLKGQDFLALEREDPDWELASERERREEQERQMRTTLEAVEAALGSRIQTARLSARLSESPAVLVNAPGSMGPHMARALAQKQQAPRPPARILELNPAHAWTARLQEVQAKDPSQLTRLAELLYGQALLAEGSPLEDPRRFAQLLTSFVLAGPSST